MIRIIKNQKIYIRQSIPSDSAMFKHPNRLLSELSVASHKINQSIFTVFVKIKKNGVYVDEPVGVIVGYNSGSTYFISFLGFTDTKIICNNPEIIFGFKTECYSRLLREALIKPLNCILANPVKNYLNIKYVGSTDDVVLKGRTSNVKICCKKHVLSNFGFSTKIKGGRTKKVVAVRWA